MWGGESFFVNLSIEKSFRIHFAQALLMGPDRMIVCAYAQMGTRCSAPKFVQLTLTRALNPEGD